MSAKRYIDDSFLASIVSPPMLDELWADGWRHQGHLFFRYNRCIMEGRMHDILPIRVRLADFSPSKSQRRILRANEDVTWNISPAYFDASTHQIFHLHTERFRENVPETIYSFFTASPADTPCVCHGLRVYLEGKLAAVSYMDLGENAASSVYAIFHPRFAKRSLGTLTMLKEIEYARSLGYEWLYPGYGTRDPSHYDYKWQFSGSQFLNWERGQWEAADLRHVRTVKTLREVSLEPDPWAEG